MDKDLKIRCNEGWFRRDWHSGKGSCMHCMGATTESALTFFKVNPASMRPRSSGKGDTTCRLSFEKSLKACSQRLEKGSRNFVWTQKGRFEAVSALSASFSGPEPAW